jgi:hypothetical protein
MQVCESFVVIAITAIRCQLPGLKTMHGKRVLCKYICGVLWSTLYRLELHYQRYSREMYECCCEPRLVVNPVHKVGISGDVSRYNYKAEAADTVLNIRDFWDVSPRRLVNSYRRFELTIVVHLYPQGQTLLNHPVTVYQSTWRNIPIYLNRHQCRCENLKSGRNSFSEKEFRFIWRELAIHLLIYL